jgi:hypothetical protein
MIVIVANVREYESERTNNLLISKSLCLTIAIADPTIKIISPKLANICRISFTVVESTKTSAVLTGIIRNEENNKLLKIILTRFELDSSTCLVVM